MRIGRTTKSTDRRDEDRLRELDRRVSASGASQGAPVGTGPCASLVQNVAQAFSAGVWTPVRWDIAVVDTHHVWVNPGTGNTIYPCPVSGLYLVSGAVYIPTNTRRVIGIKRNGAWVYGSQGEASAGGVDTVALTPSKILACSEGDALELFCLSVAAGSTYVDPTFTNAGGSAFDIAWQAPLPAA